MTDLSKNSLSNLLLRDFIAGDCFAGRFGHPVLPRHSHFPVHRARDDGEHELIRVFLTVRSAPMNIALVLSRIILGCITVAVILSVPRMSAGRARNNAGLVRCT